MMEILRKKLNDRKPWRSTQKGGEGGGGGYLEKYKQMN